MYLPGAHFLRSRFHNLQVATEEHEQAFKSDLQMRGFNPCPVLISPLSSLAWCVVNSAHQGLALQRQTVTGSHLGYGKIMIKTDKFVRIGKLRSLVKEVRAGCIICKSQLDISLDLQPGKVNAVATMKPSDHHTAIQLDLLPSIKLNNWPDQKTTRNSTKFTCHICHNPTQLNPELG